MPKKSKTNSSAMDSKRVKRVVPCNRFFSKADYMQPISSLKVNYEIEYPGNAQGMINLIIRAELARSGKLKYFQTYQVSPTMRRVRRIV